MRHTIEHVFDTSPERLWEVFFFDEAYARGLYERLRLRVERRDLQHEGSGDTLIVRRKLVIVPERELPPALRRLMAGAASYGVTRATAVTETSEFNAALRRYSVRIDLPMIGAMVDYGGDYTWESLPSGQLRRVWTGRCEARIPLVSAKIEQFLLGEVERSLADGAVYTRQYLREHASTGQTAAKA